MFDRPFVQPSVMSAQDHFSGVPSADIERSTFDRSHALKTTFDAGLLVPVYVDEVLPGDTFQMTSTQLARLATPLKPIMDNLYLDVQFWFVPYRLVWDNWQKFMGEKVNPGDSTVYTIPQVPIPASASGPATLSAYMGIPFRAQGLSTTVSVLPQRAYLLIWNEWYRDQNLQNSVTVPTGDGPDSAQVYPLRRGKRHDYFTSCLPWPQKGSAVSIPLVGSLPVKTSATDTVTGAQQALKWLQNTGSAVTGGALNISSSAGNPTLAATTNAGTPTQSVYPSNLFADMSSATAVTINDLRQAFQIQKLLERDARGGTRYIEVILSHFGVRSPDARLQRPEYLGGGSSRVNIDPIAQTSVAAATPQGNLAAIGAGVQRCGFEKSFTEHGVIIGIASARADLTYQQGIERFWSRQTRYDFYWPALAHLGEQPVLNKEIYVQGTGADTQVFGYQERYAEYRYKPSRITGLFNSDAPSTLHAWHLSQQFTALPVLGATFIQDDPPIDRCIAVPAEPHFIADFWFDLKCTRPMPVYSVPGLIDHF